MTDFKFEQDSVRIT